QLANHHWRSVKLKYSFVCWRKYVNKRHAKKNQIAAALEWRQTEFLRLGINLWLTQVIEYSKMKEKLVEQHSAIKAAALMRRVAKYAQHWRLITIRRKLARERCANVYNLPTSTLAPDHFYSPLGDYRAPTQSY